MGQPWGSKGHPASFMQNTTAEVFSCSELPHSWVPPSPQLRHLLVLPCQCPQRGSGSPSALPSPVSPSIGTAATSGLCCLQLQPE